MSAISATPSIISETEAREHVGTINPTFVERRLARPRAMAFGRYPNSLMAAKTRSRVLGLTFSGLFKTRDTVANETSATRATS